MALVLKYSIVMVPGTHLEEREHRMQIETSEISSYYSFKKRFAIYIYLYNYFKAINLCLRQTPLAIPKNKPKSDKN